MLKVVVSGFSTPENLNSRFLIMVSRRKFIRNTVAGTAALTGSSGIFFPKPGNTSNLNYLLSAVGTSTAVYNTLVASNIARNSSQTLPPMTEPAIVNTVQNVQERLIEDGYTLNPTPFSQRLGNPNSPIWGKQRNDNLGPNPGFGTVQIQRNEVLPISFTGSTTVGIDGAIKILSDSNYTAEELDNALLPVRARFEDWGSWDGDVEPKTGELISTISTTNYETRYGSVLRVYEVQEPGSGGFGLIRFDIRGGQRVNERVYVRIQFS